MKSRKRFAVCLVLLSLLCSFIPTADAEESTAPNTETIDTTEATNPEEAAVLSPDASASENDLAVVIGDGITFKLFNYSTAINKDTSGTAWRPLSNYFTFRNSSQLAGDDAASFDIPNPNCNEAHDQDGFTKYHATVERVLDTNGMPVLDLTRNADGSARIDPGVAVETRSLAYLFSDTGDHAVTSYSPENTILQKFGSRYLYKSSTNAVDYDTQTNLFRLRSYVERNSTTAARGSEYGDFLPFTYTGGNVVGTNGDEVDYHVTSQNTDYWFGMTMEVNFFQAKNGMLDSEEMVFRFSGDDDVWVFVDDVLVLDLGGTHGTVDGSINFVTGEIRQYLSWGGANEGEAEKTGGSDTSFPTTLRACFDAAGRTPRGGWSENGNTFADYSEHTLKFFYLERGASVANCTLDFLLPTLPDKSLTVTKELTGENEEVSEFLQDTISYRFRVMKADEIGNSTGELFLSPGTAYDLLENGVKIRSEVLDADGFFTLRSGQSAQFTEMLKKGGGAVHYVIEEILPDEQTGQYSGVTYQIAASGGEARVEDGPTEEFTAFQSSLLSAEETQIVTFRNRVNTSQLCHLNITKKLAEGAFFPPEQVFQIQVRLGGNLLPIGTTYHNGSETRTVTDAGILELSIGETVHLSQGILTGTTYEITELGTGEGRLHASYHGTVTPEGPITCTEAGVTGSFHLGSTVNITVTNADYDFPVYVPLRKEALDNQTETTFTFLAEQVIPDGDGWTTVKQLPGTTITVSDHRPVDDFLVIGLSADASGKYYYRIREEQGAEGFLYDNSFYIVEITADSGTAAITALLKNGTQILHPDAPLSFVNQKTTKLTVSKSVSGYAAEEPFPFTATVLLNGQPFSIPKGENYSVDENIVTFSLSDGASVTITQIPVGAVITLTEYRHDGYHVTYQQKGIDDQPRSGDTLDIFMGHSPEIVHFENTSGYQLPLTGGSGTYLYTAAGLLLILTALLMYIPKLKGLYAL